MITDFPPIYKLINENDKPPKIKKINQYLLVEKLGSGYFSKVYLALNQDQKNNSADNNTKVDSYYAAKAIHVHESFHNSKTFEREIKLLRILNHPNIIKFHTVLYAPSTDMAYIMMEFADCGTLQQAIIKKQIFSERTIASIFLQISLALSYLHSKGIIHRDVKPSNILLFSDGTAKLADFGISHFEDSAEAVCGTPSYQAPDLFEGVHSDIDFLSEDIIESCDFDQKLTNLKKKESENSIIVQNSQIETENNLIISEKVDLKEKNSKNIANCNECINKNNNKNENNNKYKSALDDSIINEWKIDPKKGDVWSLGVSMYQTAFGVLPYDGQNVYEIINKINNSPLVIPQNKERQYSPLFIDLLLKMLKKNSSERLSIEDVINHPFFVRYQSTIASEKQNDDSKKNDENLIFIKNKRIMKKPLFDIKQIQPHNYYNAQIVKIDAIICPENYQFISSRKKKSIYSFYRYTFIDDNC